MECDKHPKKSYKAAMKRLMRGGWVGGAGQAMADGKKQTEPPTNRVT